MRNRAIDFIKLVALVCMVLSHSRFIFPEYSFNLIVVGRWVFILFAFVLAYNLSKILSFSHLSSIKTYFVYLIIFAVLSEGPHNLLVSTDNSFHVGPFFPTQHNILYTYIFGFISVLVFSISENIFLKFFVTGAFLSILSSFSRKLEYGLSGIVLILAFYAYLSTPSRFKYLYLFIALYCSILATSQYYDSLNPILLISILLAFSFVVFVSKFDIQFYVPKMGRWLYFFYPIHMAVIYIIVSYTLEN